MTPSPDLLHFMATEMLNAGVLLPVVARRLDHQRPSTTLNFYAQVVPGGDALAAATLEALLAGGADRSRTSAAAIPVIEPGRPSRIAIGYRGLSVRTLGGVHALCPVLALPVPERVRVPSAGADTGALEWTKKRLLRQLASRWCRSASDDFGYRHAVLFGAASESLLEFGVEADGLDG